MNTAKIDFSSQSNVSSKRSSLDSHESRLRKQITDLQEKKKTISNDRDKTSEEKKTEKQAVQEEIQTLNNELRQYQIQKRQEEAARKMEAMKEASKDAEKKEADEELEPKPTVFGNEESGVLISLSTTKKQLANMQRIRTHLRGRQRTASTDGEKADLQKRVNTVSRNIGRKITITEDTVSNFRDSKKKGADTKQNKTPDFHWKEQPEIIDTTDGPEAAFGGNMIANRKRFFSTVSVFIK